MSVEPRRTAFYEPWPGAFLEARLGVLGIGSNLHRRCAPSFSRRESVVAMRIKGTAIRSMLLGLERFAGKADVDRVKAAMPAEIRGLIEPLVLASKYYPVDVSAALQEAIRNVLGGGSCAMNHRIGMEAARIDFGGVYTVFLRVADYETTLRRLDGAWKQYNSQGEVVWTTMRPTFAQGVIRGVAGYNEPMWHAIAGRLEAIILLAGAKKASSKVMTWTPEGCTLEIGWTR